MVKKEDKTKKEEVSKEVEETTLDEKELLKQAEEREKERKEQEEAEKKVSKEKEKEEKEKEKEVREQRKQIQVRKKPRHGKKYREIAKKIEDKEYAVDEAVKLALETNPAKFDATVEAHFKVNTKEKNIRGMVVLPGGATKEKKVLEVTESNVDEVIASIKAGKIDFDVLIADQKVMPKIAVLAKILGPKGLMPSPKAGTVVDDVKKAAEELKGGKVEFRADKTNIVHMSLGKISFGQERLKSNFEAILSHLPKRIDSIFLTTTMGPSIRVAKK